MDEALEALLRRVAAGEISPEAAEPLVAGAMAASRDPSTAGPGATQPAATEPPEASEPSGAPSPRSGEERWASDGSRSSVSGGGTEGRAVRIQVTEAGKMVVNLRVPMSWTGLTSLVPGLSESQAARVSEALRAGQRGRVLDIQDAQGDGVIISTE